MLNRNVPRYTSYPTAPHFTPSVGADIYASWLDALGEHASLSLYLHVPFCAQLCLYCGCNTKVTLRRPPIKAYAQRLIGEINLLAGAVGRHRIAHLHWGGGTPSILGPEGLREIHAALLQAFDLDEVGEHAIELDPRHVTAPLAGALAQIGVNRASLGVQDLNVSVQNAIGRVQPIATVKNAVAMLAEAGITKINFDLMYGLPRQTVNDIRDTIQQAHALSPSRLAVFGYAHVPWMKPHQRLIDEAALPGFGERQAQAAAAHAALVALGYQPIGLDHYARQDDELAAAAARQGRLHRNFQGYTADDADALIGLGASAIGRLPQGYVQNAPDIAGYSRAIDAGKFASVKGLAVTADDRLRGHVIERLMCDLSIDLAAAAGDAGLGRDYFSQELDSLAPFRRDGLVDVDGYQIRVSEKGRPFVRILAAVFDLYLQEKPARHSLAV